MRRSAENSENREYIDLPNGKRVDCVTGIILNENGESIDYLQQQEITFLQLHLNQVLTAEQVVNAWYEETGETIAIGTVSHYRSTVSKKLEYEFESPHTIARKRNEVLKREFPDYKRSHHGKRS
jgi:hypothetical protein